MTADHTTIFRLLDANLNRAVEGLRVLEECARMLLDDAPLTSRIKDLRHRTTALVRNDPALDRALLFARDIGSDVLKSGATSSELKRDDLASLLRANARRAAEAVRAIEEYGKLISPDMAVACKDIRFAVYALEQDVTAAITRRNLLTPDRIHLGLAIDCSLDTGQIRAHLDLAGKMGAGLVVLDAGGLNDRAFHDAVRYIVDTIGHGTTTLLVAGRADIASAADADGVILDDTTIAPANARAIIGPGRVIGYLVTNDHSTETASCDNVDLELRACDDGHFVHMTHDFMKPRIRTGVSKEEAFASIPFNRFDGFLFTPLETPAATIALAQTASDFVRHQTEDGTDISHDTAG